MTNVERMHLELASMEDFKLFMERYKYQKDLAKHFGVTSQSLNYWVLNLEVKERAKERVARKLERIPHE